MQNKIVKMTRASLALMVMIWLGTLPALAQGCADWVDEDKAEGYWQVATLEQVQTCLNDGADVHARNKNGLTPLHWAASGNENPKMIITLLDAGADLYTRDKFGRTPLHMATSEFGNENLEVIMTLLDVGLDINARDIFGESPLHNAAFWNKNPEMIITLLKAGADGKARNREGRTPFEAAENNENLKDTKAYWLLNDAQYKKDPPQ